MQGKLQRFRVRIVTYARRQEKGEKLLRRCCLIVNVCVKFAFGKHPLACGSFWGFTLSSSPCRRLDWRWG